MSKSQSYTTESIMKLAESMTIGELQLLISEGTLPADVELIEPSLKRQDIEKLIESGKTEYRNRKHT